MFDIVIEKGNEKFLLNDEGDRYVLKEIYDENTYQVKITPDMRVLDIGANKGIFSVWCAMQGAKVEAYEASPITYSYLLKNIKLNNLSSRINCYNFGVWSRKDILTFYANSWNSGGSTFYPRVTNRFSEEVKVETIPFDTVLGDVNWNIVKIDTEGSEYEIILSSNKLNQIDRLEIECHYWAPDGGWTEIPDTERQNSSVELFDKMLEKLSKYFNGTKVLNQIEYPHGLMLHLTRK